MAFSNMRIVAGTVISAVGDMVVNNDNSRTRSGAGKSFTGNNLTVTEDDATVVGDGCNVIGDMCKVTGNGSYVNGNGCIVTGHGCTVTGNGCKVTGNGSYVNGNGCTIDGDECVVQGNDCVIRGARAFTTGQGNVVNGAHASATGETCVVVGGARAFASGYHNAVHGSHYNGPARRGTRPPPDRQDAPDLFFALGGVTVVNNRGGNAVSTNPEHVPIPQEAPVRATVFDAPQPDVELSDEDAERTPDRACTICMSNSRVVVALPCLHSTLCHTCCGRLKDSGAKDPATGLHLCPQCRSGVERFGHIYN
jgi:Zinc finger, C3HC4 type (RING finger)